MAKYQDKLPASLSSGDAQVLVSGSEDAKNRNFESCHPFSARRPIPVLDGVAVVVDGRSDGFYGK